MSEATQSPGTHIGRYRVEGLLGRGGMGQVYRVEDPTDGRKLALKRLSIAQGPARSRAEALFASEYQVLSELSHPRVVSVHDYGIDEHGPFYVMDLVGGQDLRKCAPMEWKQACAVLHDVCTALSLLHARRLAHRDVSPRNVRLDDDGRATLIDFGAMTPFGPGDHAVGTPPFVAPEVVHGQRIDGRTDLYSLGALGYFLLTGRNAYAAHDWRQLRDLWRSRPVPVGATLPEIPSALDQLITKLMSLDMAARPDSVTEVLDRLEVVADLPAGDVEYAQSFLVSPSLIGRDDVRMSFRKRMVRAMRGRGSSVLLQGPPGSGRSRLLESHALEGKLVGALVMQARARSCGTAPYATMLSLLRQFRDAAPEFFGETIEPYLAVLAHISPELQPPDEDAYQLVEYPEPAAQRAAIQRSLVRWIRSLRQQLCVLLIVDDLDHADTESAAVIIELAALGGGSRVVIAASARHEEAQREGSAAHQLGALGARGVLRDLGRPQVGELLRSIFGEQPNLEPLADWAFMLSQGNAGICMHLAQHLVDQGLVRLEEDRWLLPAEPDQLALPQRLDGALELSLRSLGDEARSIAQLIALTMPAFPLKLAHFRALAGDPDGDGAQVPSALDELRRAGVLSQSGDHWVFTHTLMRNAARGLPSTAGKQALHYRLAEAYDDCSAPAPVIAHHLLQAGEPDRAYERAGLASVDGWRDAPDNPTTRFFLSPEGIELAKFALKYAQDGGRSQEVCYRWRKTLLSLSIADPSLAEHAPAVLEALRRDTGLCYLPEIDSSLEQSQRVEAMMKMATEAREATTAAERGLGPVPALFDLGAVVLSLCGSYTRTWQTERFDELLALSEPLRGVSPASMLVHDTVVLCHRSLVRGEEVGALRRQLFDLTSQPVPGMDEPTRFRTHLNLAFYRGIDEAIGGSVDALTMADLLERNPGHRSLGHQIRFVHHLAQGERTQARAAEARRNLFALGESSGTHTALGALWAVQLHYAGGDLIALRQLRPHFEQQAALYPGWKPWQLLTEGMYQILHDDHVQADALLGDGLALVEPLQHAAWQHLSVHRIESALGMGDHALAEKRTRELDALIEREQAQVTIPDALAALGAIAIAHTGAFDEAVLRIDRRLAVVRKQRITGVQASLLYEARARIALMQGDMRAFDSAARRVAAQYRPGQHPGLLARYERLMDDAVAARIEVSPSLAAAAKESADDVATDPTFVSELQTLLGGCHGHDERALTALKLLVERTGADAGYLYGCRGPDALELIAQLGARPPTAAVQKKTRAFFEDAIDGGATVKPSVPPPPGEQIETDLQDADFEPHLLWRRRDGAVLIAGVAVLRIADRDMRLPFELLSALSDALLDAGDVQPANLP